MQVAHLANHRVSVHLAHVVPSVVLLCLTHMKQPRIGVVVADTVAGNAGNNVFVDGQNHLPVDVDPGNLKISDINESVVRKNALRFSVE